MRVEIWLKMGMGVKTMLKRVFSITKPKIMLKRVLRGRNSFDLESHPSLLFAHHQCKVISPTNRQNEYCFENSFREFP